jgi:large subunit ribosomal protein L25
MATPSIPRVDVEPRQHLGSRYASRLRRAGRLPAVIYGHGQPTVHVALDRQRVTDLVHRHAHLLEVVLDGKPEPVLIKDVQWDALGSFIIHLDLTRVDLNERVRVEVRLVFTGEAVGLKEEGAIQERPVARVGVECLATQIPDQIKADVAHLGVGDTLTVRDLKLPEGVTATMHPDTVLASITIMAEEVVEVVPVEGAAAEPEVIGKKLEEGEEGAAAEGAPAAGEKKAAAPAAAEKKPAEKAEKK